jgi:hypothetical protein
VLGSGAQLCVLVSGPQLYKQLVLSLYLAAAEVPFLQHCSQMQNSLG